MGSMPPEEQVLLAIVVLLILAFGFVTLALLL